MVFVIFPEMVPKEKYAVYAAILSTNSAFANLAGPLLGGLINTHASWKWVFFLKYVSAQALHVSTSSDSHHLQRARRSDFNCPHPVRSATEFSSSTHSRSWHRICFQFAQLSKTRLDWHVSSTSILDSNGCRVRRRGNTV